MPELLNSEILVLLNKDKIFNFIKNAELRKISYDVTMWLNSVL